MKVLQINNFFTNEGGTEKIMYETATILRNNGHEVFFFATDKKPYIEPDYEYAKYFPQYIDYRKLGFPGNSKYIIRTLYNHEAKTKLEQYLKDIKPDIIHCHNIYYHLTPSILKACKKYNIPVLMTFHDLRLMCPSCTLLIGGKKYCAEKLCLTGNSLHCVINKCKDKSLAASIIAALEFRVNRQNKIYDNVTKFICISRSTIYAAIKSGIPKEKISFIPNFLPDSNFEIEPAYHNNSYFLFTGRLVIGKGLDLLVGAFKELTDLKLLIAGKGPEELRLKTLCENEGIQNIEFVGFKQGNDLQDLYQNCLATIFSSDGFETFGLSIVESFIHGKPVIASKRSSVPDIVEHNKNGLLFAPGNKLQLINSVKRLANNTDLASKLGRNGRLKAERLYNPRVYYEKLSDLYYKLLESKVS